MSVIAGVALGLSAAALIVHLVSILLVLPRLRPQARPAIPPSPAPPVTILRPVHGLEHQLEETLGSGLRLDYPDYETLFCAEDEDDPAVALVRALIARHPGAKAQLLIGRDPVSGNPKLNNLIKGWRAASGDWVAMADSNIILPPDYLSQLLTCWDGRCGLVSSPPAGVAPEGFGGTLECAFLNGHQARWQLAADQLGLGYAQGKTLFWKRAFLQQAGGPEVLGAQMAEDVASTKLVRGAGLSVRLARRPFAHPVGHRALSGVWRRQLRWAKIRKLGFRRLFLAELLSGSAAPLLALGAGLALAGLPAAAVAALMAAYGALWYGAEWYMARVAGWPAAPGDIAAGLLRDMLIPVIWIAAWGNDNIVWQGNRVTAGAAGAGNE